MRVVNLPRDVAGADVGRGGRRGQLLGRGRAQVRERLGGHQRVLQGTAARGSSGSMPSSM